MGLLIGMASNWRLILVFTLFVSIAGTIGLQHWRIGQLSANLQTAEQSYLSLSSAHAETVKTLAAVKNEEEANKQAEIAAIAEADKARERVQNAKVKIKALHDTGIVGPAIDSAIDSLRDSGAKADN